MALAWNRRPAASLVSCAPGSCAYVTRKTPLRVRTSTSATMVGSPLSSRDRAQRPGGSGPDDRTVGEGDGVGVGVVTLGVAVGVAVGVGDGRACGFPSVRIPK